MLGHYYIGALKKCGYFATLWHYNKFGIATLWHHNNVALLHCGITIIWHCYIAALQQCSNGTPVWHYINVAFNNVALLHCCIATLWHHFTFSKSFCSSEVKQESNLHLKASNKFSFQYIWLFGGTFVCVNANSFSFEFSTHILRDAAIEEVNFGFVFPKSLPSIV